ncbi:MAG: hypothetical protein HY092_04180 [Candidatus Kerfeldbacteria bacterium]|nr:hypothetical protein [Candidatus Kerfeldbacteria bacterium]
MPGRSLFRILGVPIALVVLGAVLVVPNMTLATSGVTFNQSITGTLDIGIVDGSGNTVGSPSITFSSKTFTASGQTSTGTLGSASQKMRVTNPTSTATWALTVAATSGNTTLWSDGSNTMDFNGSASAGRLTVDASGSTLAGVGGTSTSNITKGSSTSFVQGTTDSITLLSAGGSAAAPGQWDLTSVSLTQDIPALQATGNYSIGMTLTAS